MRPQFGLYDDPFGKSPKLDRPAEIEAFGPMIFRAKTLVGRCPVSRQVRNTRTTIP